MNIREGSKFGGFVLIHLVSPKIKWMIAYILNFYNIIIGLLKLIYFMKENFMFTVLSY